MSAVPEKNKKPGVFYALTNDGVELPVIDLSHPAFAFDLSEAELAAQTAAYIKEAEASAWVPPFLMRPLLRFFLRKSVLGRGISDAAGGFLTGMNTYLFKLGPDNLGEGWATPVDRKIAASLGAVAMRLRLADVARMIAEGLAQPLAARPGAPVHLVNIAGGPASDSLNALIRLRAALEGRSLFVHDLDLHEDGADFGARAAAALGGPGGPLAGLDLRFERVPYRWTEVRGLAAFLATLPADAVMVASSEGGLFEYGSDEEIVANLDALRRGSPADTSMVGSVTRADGLGPYMRRSSDIPTIPRRLEDFEALAARAGWRVVEVLARPFSYNLRLVKG